MPRFSANGTLLRINYQIDGNTNTQKDRAGLRLLPVSEVMVREVKVVTSRLRAGVRPDHRPRLQRDHAIGNEHVRGSASYRFRRKDFAAFPFFFAGPHTDDRKPRDEDRHLHGGARRAHCSRTSCTSSAGSRARRATCRASASSRSLRPTRPLLGLDPQPSIFPTEQTARFYIGKGDWTINPAHRAHRALHRLPERLAEQPEQLHRADLDRPGGGLPRRDGLDLGPAGRRRSATTGSTSCVSSMPPAHQSRTPNDAVGHRAVHPVSGVADFGGPLANTAEAGFGFTQGIWQVVDNFTLHPRQPQLQVRLRHPARRRYPHQRAAVPLHVPVDPGLQRRAQRHQPEELHQLSAVAWVTRTSR